MQHNDVVYRLAATSGEGLDWGQAVIFGEENLGPLLCPALIQMWVTGHVS